MKNKKSKFDFSNLVIILAISLVLGLYWRWFLPAAITLGDWGYYTKSALSDMTGGLWFFGYQIIGAWIQPLIAFGGFLSRVSSWDYSIIERLTNFFPILLCLIFSPWYLARTLGFNRIGIAATILAFNLNTGIFTTVAIPIFTMAIALGLFILATFIKLAHKPSIRHGLTFALATAIQMLYEIRIAYIFLLFCGLYFIYFWLTSTKEFHSNLFKIIKILFLAILMLVLLHSFWIIPLFGAKGFNAAMTSRYAGYDSPQWVRTLSYWELLHVLGIQATSWGKPGIINPPNPQFLFLPILVFSVFLFFRKLKPIVLFFGLSAGIFSFLAKGSKPPCGEVYIWLFEHFPGFFMFREPGKWYSPIILSYAILFGALADQLTQTNRLKQFFSWASKQFKLSLHLVKIGLIGVITALFFIIFPVQPISVFKKLDIFIWRVPAESGYLEHFLHQQPNFFRILWLPYPYCFGYSSSQHQAFSAVELGQGLFSSLNYSNIFSYLNHPLSMQILRLLSVKYIIVPSVPVDYLNEFYFWYSLPPEYYHNLAKDTRGVHPIDFEGESKIYEMPDYLPLLYTNPKSHIILKDYDLPLSTIAAVDCLKEKNPALIFPGQILDIKSNLFTSNNFILQDRTFADLAIEFAGSYKMPLSVSDKNGNQKLKFKLNKIGIFEAWIDVSKISFDDNPNLMVIAKIDRQSLNNTLELPLALIKDRDNEHTKYVKLGESNLKSGSHVLVLNMKNIESQRSYSSEILLVEKEARIAAEDTVVSNLRLPKKNISYIFTRDSSFWTTPQNIALSENQTDETQI